MLAVFASVDFTNSIESQDCKGEFTISICAPIYRREQPKPIGINQKLKLIGMNQTIFSSKVPSKSSERSTLMKHISFSMREDCANVPKTSVK